MILPFRRIASGLDVAPLMAQLDRHSELWGQQAARIGADSPHSESTDIWLRYRNLEDYAAQYGNDLSHFCDEHESVWLSPANDLPAGIGISRIVQDLVGGDLGGVLLTRLPPGAQIKPHIDRGWHAAAHDKYYVAVKVRSGAEFCWETGSIKANDGDIYQFRNDLLHWVVNESPEERIAMIVCIKPERA